MLQTANSMAEKEYMCCQITAMGINDNDMAICHFLKESPNLKIPSSNKGAITNNTINRINLTCSAYCNSVYIIVLLNNINYFINYILTAVFSFSGYGMFIRQLKILIADCIFNICSADIKC